MTAIVKQHVGPHAGRSTLSMNEISDENHDVANAGPKLELCRAHILRAASIKKLGS